MRLLEIRSFDPAGVQADLPALALEARHYPKSVSLIRGTKGHVTREEVLVAISIPQCLV
jgi:hypothetical protein